MKFVHIQNKISLLDEHELDSIIHAMLNGLPTFFMAEKTENFTMAQELPHGSCGK